MNNNINFFELSYFSEKIKGQWLQSERTRRHFNTKSCCKVINFVDSFDSLIIETSGAENCLRNKTLNGYPIATVCLESKKGWIYDK